MDGGARAVSRCLDRCWGGGVPLLLTLPTAASPAVGALMGTQLAEDVGDDLPSREPCALTPGPARRSLVGEMSPTMAYRLSPYKPGRGERL